MQSSDAVPSLLLSFQHDVHSVNGRQSFWTICTGFLGPDFVLLLEWNQQALTSSTGSRAVGPHHAPAVVGLPLSTGHCVLPQDTWVLPLQQDLYGTSHRHLVSVTTFLRNINVHVLIVRIPIGALVFSLSTIYFSTVETFTDS